MACECLRLSDACGPLELSRIYSFALDSGAHKAQKKHETSRAMAKKNDEEPMGTIPKGQKGDKDDENEASDSKLLSKAVSEFKKEEKEAEEHVRSSS